jgi:hypothetical protein
VHFYEEDIVPFFFKISAPDFMFKTCNVIYLFRSQNCHQCFQKVSQEEQKKHDPANLAAMNKCSQEYLLPYYQVKFSRGGIFN